jgi:uroporphyrinogen-III synthase
MVATGVRAGEFAPRGNLAREVIVDGLSAAGALVETSRAYRTEPRRRSIRHRRGDRARRLRRGDLCVVVVRAGTGDPLA